MVHHSTGRPSPDATGTVRGRRVFFIFLFVTVLNSGADLVIFISVQHFGYIIIINLANLKFVQTVTQEF